MLSMLNDVVELGEMVMSSRSSTAEGFGLGILKYTVGRFNTPDVSSTEALLRKPSTEKVAVELFTPCKSTLLNVNSPVVVSVTRTIAGFGGRPKMLGTGLPFRWPFRQSPEIGVTVKPPSELPA